MALVHKLYFVLFFYYVFQSRIFNGWNAKTSLSSLNNHTDSRYVNTENKVII